ncbi:transposase family protein [Bremerella cremea]|uniref:Transposase family protein n=1 Tax=Bremerella cremea TaxID=1031537 RepID=A0A368KPK1_9BACT|nr:transposase family protein [Bremerella cremea]
MSGPAALIYKQFVKVTDPRADRGKNHDLLEMIFLALTATICGANIRRQSVDYHQPIYIEPWPLVVD